MKGMRFWISVFILCTFNLSFVSAQQPPGSEEQFKSYFQQYQNNLNPIEGIWRVTTTQEYYRNDTLYEIDKVPKSVRVAIIKKEEKFESYNLTGESYDVQFSVTEIAGVYFYKNYFKETGEYSKASAVISKAGEMEYSYDFPINFLQKKLGDSYEEGTRVVNITRWVKIFPEKIK